MLKLEDRKRFVDVNKLTEEQFEKTMETVNRKLTEITERAVKEANEILNIYGLETKLQFLKPYPIEGDSKKD